MRTVDARFAGGPITVDVAEMSGVPTVTLSLPGDSAGMFPSEARELAAALTTAADEAETAERRSRLRRRTDVDENLRSIEQ